jgi:hypothetical protein
MIEKRRFLNGSCGPTTNLVLFGQRLEKNLAKCPASSVHSRADRTDGDLEFRRDRLVVHLFDHTEYQHSAVIWGHPSKCLFQDAPELPAFQVMSRIIAIAFLDTLKTCSNLMAATTKLASCQMKTPMSHRRGQPRADVRRHRLFEPQADEGFLDCVPSRILVAEDAPCDRQKMPDQRACGFREVHRSTQLVRT